jgi:hypothetical protein
MKTTAQFTRSYDQVASTLVSYSGCPGLETRLWGFTQFASTRLRGGENVVCDLLGYDTVINVSRNSEDGGVVFLRSADNHISVTSREDTIHKRLNLA